MRLTIPVAFKYITSFIFYLHSLVFIFYWCFIHIFVLFTSKSKEQNKYRPNGQLFMSRSGGRPCPPATKQIIISGGQSRPPLHLVTHRNFAQTISLIKKRRQFLMPLHKHLRTAYKLFY